MISESDLQRIESTSEDGRWYVHNGFLGWAYGSPLNPTPVTRETARKLLEKMTESRIPNAVDKLAGFPSALDYADDGDVLFHASDGNRLLAYVPPSDCVFEPEYKVPTERDYEI